ncbi:MAG: transglycosylase SLT domain-containing protein [Prevotella sp.]|nr:transglycosylase SLT domain-containing protein [Prevotella sp.]
MKEKGIYILLFAILLGITGCGRRTNNVAPPWVVTSDSADQSDAFDLKQIIRNGELIMLTVSGPDTYYEYHGRGIGTQYLLCERFATKIGVSVRVELCHDSAEMQRKLDEGVGDIMVGAFPKDTEHPVIKGKGEAFDSLGWTVDSQKPLLQQELRSWYRSSMLADVRQQEAEMLSAKNRVHRRVYAPMLDRANGIISKWDDLFIANAPTAGWDWRLLAAQCYQESTFDPQAHSWAGACGLMQIMPTTADHLGLPRSQIYEPKANVEAAARLIAELTGSFSDVADRRERISFVLAAYNGGGGHIRDAMALTEKYGGNKYRWADVARYVLLLQEPQYYGDAVVRYGYMRGSETVDYVDKVNRRFNEYRGVHSPLGGSYSTPRKAQKERKSKYRS